MAAAIARQTAWLTAGYLAVTALLIGLLGRMVPGWPFLVAAHAAIAVALVRSLRSESVPRWLVVLRDWHPLVLFPLLYKEVEPLAASFGNWALTCWIPAVEAAVFRGQPSVYLSGRLPFVPLSEFLHFCYLAYVAVIPGVAAYWYVTNRRVAFDELLLLLSVVMFGSYLFFILFPVDSPYYRLERLGPPLAGHLFFDLVHAVSSRGGARGGAFPSAHVSGAVVLGMVTRRYQPRLAILLTALIVGLIVATVYGRFHYALDSLAGIALALTVVWVHRRFAV